MTQTVHTTLGDLISLFYQEFYELYGDEELASLAAATVIGDLLQRDGTEPDRLEEAA